MQSSLEKASLLVRSGTAVFAFVSANAVITSSKNGLRPLFELIEQGKCLSDGVAADKIVGFAAAVLLKRLGVRVLFAQNITERALRFLRENKTQIAYENIIPAVLNKNGGTCIFEAALWNTEDYNEALAVITVLGRKLLSSNTKLDT
jgi:uroporphyrinogen-III synthase